MLGKQKQKQTEKGKRPGTASFPVVAKFVIPVLGKAGKKEALGTGKKKLYSPPVLIEYGGVCRLKLDIGASE